VDGLLRYDRSVTVHVFYNPDLVGQLAACGITQRRAASSVPAAGFVLEGRRAPPRARQTVTNVVAAYGNVTITQERRQLPDQPLPLALPTQTSVASVASQTEPGPQTAIELAEECARLRRDNQRLTGEVTQLRAEVARLSRAPTPTPTQDQDDTATRFALLELD
jgi:hypothetical protein